jgi:WD40 repeat protein
LQLSFWSLLAAASALHWLVGGPRLVLSGHDSIVTSLAFSRDGRFLASGSWDRTIKIWNPVTGENLRTLAIEDGGRKDPVEAVAFSPDGKILAAGSRKIVSLWDTQGWSFRGNLSVGGVNIIESLIFFSAGNLLVTKSDRASGIWDVNTGETVPGVSKYLGSVAALSPDGKLLAAVPSGYGGVKIWNTNTWKELFLLSTSARSVVFSLAFSPDGRILAGGDGQNNLALWMTPDQQYVPNVLNKVGCGDAVVSLAFSSNSKWLAAIARRGSSLEGLSKPGCIKLFRLQDNQFTFMPWRTEPVGRGLAFSPDSKTLATPAQDGTIKLWRVD